jgi:hypothetical protein
VECGYRRGFGLDIGFIDHFSAQLVLTLNYSAIADFHTLQFTRAHSTSFLARSDLTSSCLVTTPNKGRSSASELKSSLKGSSLPTDSFLHGLRHRTHSVAPVVFLITPLHGTSRKHRFQQYLYCRVLIRCRGNVFTERLPIKECCFRAVR